MGKYDQSIWYVCMKFLESKFYIFKTSFSLFIALMVLVYSLICILLDLHLCHALLFWFCHCSVLIYLYMRYECGCIQWQVCT